MVCTSMDCRKLGSIGSDKSIRRSPCYDKEFPPLAWLMHIRQRRRPTALRIQYDGIKLAINSESISVSSRSRKFGSWNMHQAFHGLAYATSDLER